MQYGSCSCSCLSVSVRPVALGMEQSARCSPNPMAIPMYSSIASLVDTCPRPINSDASSRELSAAICMTDHIDINENSDNLLTHIYCTSLFSVVTVPHYLRWVTMMMMLMMMFMIV